MAFRPLLLNLPWEDPGLYLERLQEKEAWLVDCGYLGAARVRDLLRVRRVFVTHAHIDHFIGFDYLLRLNLAGSATLHVYGPPGIAAHVQGKLRGYAWNLVHDSRFVLKVHELGEGEVRSLTLPCQAGFAVTGEERRPSPGPLRMPGGEEVAWAGVDHGVPCLAFGFREPPACRVDIGALSELGVPAGPWLARLKKAALRGELEGVTEVGGRTFATAALARRVIRHAERRRIVYLTDTVLSRALIRAIRPFAEGAHELWCEAAYLHSRRDLARAHLHMTARQAGLVARRLGVGRLYLFHHSRRYQGDAEAHLSEARQLFPHTFPPPRYRDHR